MKKLEPWAGHAYALLRIVAGAMFAFHGIQKITGIMAVHQPPVGTQLWFGGLIELFGGSLVALGWRAREAAFLCSGTMAVAYCQFHWRFNFGEGFFPAINQGELAALYCFVFFLIACQGSGRWALGRK